MSPPHLLILSNDQYFPFAKTSQYLLNACGRLGFPAILRDTGDARIVCFLCETHKQTELFAEAEVLFSQKFDALITGFDINTVLSLDLQWLFLPNLMAEHPKVERVFSLWYDDFRSWARGNPTFPFRARTFQEAIKDPKVTHCFYGAAIAEEARILGFDRQRLSWLAAPEEYLHFNHPCEITDKAAFIGNPGFRGEPHKHIIQRMQEGAEIDELRRMTRDVVIFGRELKKEIWLKEEPSVNELIAVAAEARVAHPHFSALQILHLAGKNHPRALEYLDERGDILDAATLVKFINRYDRPAVIWRLYKNQWVDVYSSDNEWKPYGINALPPVFARDLPAYYQKYAVHLNACNCLRDAAANEKLFEIAACGRVSINLESPDVRKCYGEEEVVFAGSLAELEEKARAFFKEPEKARAMGKRARLRTAREHLWDHRLKALLTQGG